MLAVAHQRRRHTWTLIHGGPESGLHKSTDGGKTWRRIRTGLPGGDLGRIVIAFSPAQKGLVYAKVESSGQPVALYASLDGGDSWERRANVQAQPMYYKNIHADPKDADRVYVPSVQTQVSDDGGRTFRGLGERSQARGQPLPVDRSGRHRSSARGLRRRAVRELGRRAVVAALHQSLGDAVLQRRSRQRVADLQRLRRHAGQRHARRSVAVALARRRHQQRLVRRHRRRRVRGARRPDRSQHRLRGVAVRRHRAARSPHQRARAASSPPKAKGEAAAALQLGVALHHQSAQSVAAVLRRQSPVSQRRSRQLLARGQSRFDASDRSQPAAGHGPRVAAGGGRAAPVHRHVGQHLGGQRIAQERGHALRRHG